jgi:hypothetical protein
MTKGYAEHSLATVGGYIGHGECTAVNGEHSAG